jgi:hypothetical protein
MDKKERKKKRIKRRKKYGFMENTLRRVLLIQPPFGVMDGFETRRVGSRYRLNELLPDTQTDTEIFSFNSSLFLFSKKRTYTHSNLFSTFYCQLSYDTTYKYKSARTMGGRDRIIDANPSNKIYGKIIEIKKNKVAPVLLTSYFSENLCTRHNKSTDWCRIRYTIYIHII